MLTAPRPLPSDPLKLLAYLLFRYFSIFLYSSFRFSSSAITRITFLSASVASLTILLALRMATAFLMVSMEMAYKCRMILSVKMDWPNHWISDSSLVVSMLRLSLTSLNRYSTQIQ